MIGPNSDPDPFSQYPAEGAGGAPGDPAHPPIQVQAPNDPFVSKLPESLPRPKTVEELRKGILDAKIGFNHHFNRASSSDTRMKILTAVGFASMAAGAIPIAGVGFGIASALFLLVAYAMHHRKQESQRELETLKREYGNLKEEIHQQIKTATPEKAEELKNILKEAGRNIEMGSSEFDDAIEGLKKERQEEYLDEEPSVRESNPDATPQKRLVDTRANINRLQKQQRRIDTFMETEVMLAPVSKPRGREVEQWKQLKTKTSNLLKEQMKLAKTQKKEIDMSKVALYAAMD